MQLYLKLFETENDRSAYENGESYIEPYVSYVDGGDVHYNKVETRVVVTFHTTSDGQPQYIGGNGDNYSAKEIDGIEIPPSYTYYQIPTAGDHTGKYTLIDNTHLSTGSFNNTDIITVYLPPSIRIIDSGAFNYSSKLTNVTISNGVTTIGDTAFQGCSNLTNIVLPDTITSIGNAAFLNCSSLTSLTIKAIVPPTLAQYYVFNNTNDCPIYVPAASVDAYKAATNWSDYASRIQAIPTT